MRLRLRLLSSPTFALVFIAALANGSRAMPDDRIDGSQAEHPLRASEGSVGVETIDAPWQALELFAGHPRLIVGGFRGLSIEDLRAACERPEMQGECGRIGDRHMLDDAMRWLLVEDPAALDRAKRQLTGGVECGNGYEVTPAGGHAIAFDWLHAALSPDERRSVSDALKTCGANIATSLRGNSPHLWHGFTAQAAALALIALAVDEPSEALISDARELFRGRALEAYALTGGAWPEGYNYLRSHFFSGDPPYQYVIDALRAWDSAVARDHPLYESIFDSIAEEEGHWLSGLAYHLYYGSLPPYGEQRQRTLMRGGDMPTGQANPHKQYRPFVDSIARVYGDPYLKDWGSALEADWSFVGGTGTYHSIHRYSLPYNLPINVETPTLPPLPLSRIWGREDHGQIIARSSWGGGATILGYRAGKWLTGHQHMDQGHIDLWHKGPLLLDSGVYANWGSEHRENYYIRTIAHNSLLIPLEGESFDQHPRGPGLVNDGGQRIITYRGCPQCMQSVAEWRSNVDAGLHFEAGEVEAFADDGEWLHVASDLTSAYNSSRYAAPGTLAKVDRVQRDLSFRRGEAAGAGDLLIVVDRVRTLGNAEAPRFVLHLPARPEIEGATLLAGRAENGIHYAETDRFAVDNGSGGRLEGRTLVPFETSLTAIGGPDYRYWVDGGNREGGSTGLEAAPAEPGDWRIEIAPRTIDASAGARDWLMVHALAPGETGKMTTMGAAFVTSAETDPVAAEPVLALAISEPAGAHARNLLLRSAAVPRATIGYVELDTSPHLGVDRLALADLAPDASYRWRWVGGGGGEVRASGEGVATIDPGTGGAGQPAATRLRLGHCPAPQGAGANWTGLCGADGSPTATTDPTATAAPSPIATSALGSDLWLPLLLGEPTMR